MQPAITRNHSINQEKDTQVNAKLDTLGVNAHNKSLVSKSLSHLCIGPHSTHTLDLGPWTN